MKFILLTDIPMSLSGQSSTPTQPKMRPREWGQLPCSPGSRVDNLGAWCSLPLPPPVGHRAGDPAVQSFLHTHCCYINS